MWARRSVLTSALAAGAAAFLSRARAEAQEHRQPEPAPTVAKPYTPVTTPNGATLPFTMKNGVKEFHLIAEEVESEFAPGFKVKGWGYNGRSPGPTIEAVEGDRVRILVTNRLPEPTSIHWHGVLLPNGMDGVSGLTQPPIPPGETFAYEFPLRQHGTQMYHPHADEMVQMALGMMGMFVIHPKAGEPEPIDRDFALLLHNFMVHPGSSRPDPAVMTDFNLWTINGRVYPGTAPLVVKTGDRVRLRLGNLSMHEHPMHIHGHQVWVTGTDGGRIPPNARWPEATALVGVGQTRDLEFIADAPGDWAFHCHKTHHTMNAMGHDIPNTVGVDQGSAEEKIRRLLPGYMAMGETGMGGMSAMADHMPGPANTLPMTQGDGPFGPIEMGGMFTIIKVRDNLLRYDEDPGWYKHPEGTVAWKVGTASTKSPRTGHHPPPRP